MLQVAFAGNSHKAADDVSSYEPFKVKRHRQRVVLKLAARPPGFKHKPTAPPGPQGSSLVGPDTRFSPSSRRRFSSIEPHDTQSMRRAWTCG